MEAADPAPHGPQRPPGPRGPCPLTWVKSHSRCAGRATSSHFFREGVRALPSSTRHLESGRKAVEPSGPSCSRPSALYRTSWRGEGASEAGHRDPRRPLAPLPPGTPPPQAWPRPYLGRHPVAGVEDGSVVVLRPLVQAVAAGLAVSHLRADAEGARGGGEAGGAAPQQGRGAPQLSQDSETPTPRGGRPTVEGLPWGGCRRAPT